MDHSAIDFLSKSANRKVRKLLGRAYLRENRITEALGVYQGLLAEVPDDPDVLMILANLYRLAGCPRAAESLYEMVMASDGGYRLARKLAHQLEMAVAAHPDGAVLMPGSGEDDALDPLSKAAFDRLADRLHAISDPQRAEQVREAAEVLESANPDDWPADGNGLGAEEVQTLMPALIELNIRQARAAGFPDLAEALQSLRLSLTHHIDDRWAEDLLKDENTLDMRD